MSIIAVHIFEDITWNCLVPEIACYGDCAGARGKLVAESLFSMITTGAGVDVFGR